MNVQIANLSQQLDDQQHLALVSELTPAALNPEQNEANDKDDEEFLWRADNEDIVLMEQRPTALYRNAWGQIVIRQQANWNDDQDSFVCIAPEHLEALIVRLQAMLPGERS